MRLPIPFEYEGRIIDDLEIKAPSSGVLAETQRVAEGGKMYAAFSVLTAGCLDEEDARAMVRVMPYRTCELLAIHAVLKISPDDGFEGVYQCPRCGHKQVTEYSEDEDTRDFVSDLYVGYADAAEPFEVELDSAVTVTSKGEAIEQVSTLTFHHPTMQECQKAESRVGLKNPTKLNFAVLALAIDKVDGREVDDRWRTNLAPVVFEKMAAKDLAKINAEIARYGMSSTLPKVCHECGKEWDAPVNTSGFFASALR